MDKKSTLIRLTYDVVNDDNLDKKDFVIVSYIMNCTEIFGNYTGTLDRLLEKLEFNETFDELKERLNYLIESGYLVAEQSKKFPRQFSIATTFNM